MLNDLEKGIIHLVKSGLKNEKADLPENFDAERIYSIAQMHQIRLLLFTGAVASGIKSDTAIMRKFFESAYKEMLSNEKKDYWYKELIAVFEENEIDYMPLKGIFLKELYPQPAMRCMGDIDILINISQYEKIKEILPSVGFKFNLESDHELVWYTKDGVCIELHKRLIPSYNKDYYSYFDEGWDRAKKVNESQFLYRLSPEDEFVYLFTHFSKHYRDGGIGIKHFVDLYLYLEKINPDRKYIECELKKLGLYKFYLNVIRTMDVWFGDAECDEIIELISRTILQSGAYGKDDNKSAATVLRKSAEDPSIKKGAGVIRRLFLPYKSMCIKYPYLKKYPFLLPISYIIRIIDVIINKPENIELNIKQIKATTPQKIEEYDRRLKDVGLEYNFKE